MRFVRCVISIFGLAALAWEVAVAAPAGELLSGPEFERQLNATTGVDWTGVPLRDALESVAKDQNIAVMLDRRVDPGQPIDLALVEQRLEDALKTIARHANLGECTVDSVVYFGPSETTAKLATVAALRRAEAERLPRERAARFARARPWGWETLATPRALLTQLLEEAGAKCDEADRVPHDLWPAVKLPPLSVCDRLTLVLAGFGATYRFSPDGSQIDVVPLPETAALDQTYPGKGHAAENAQRISRLCPDATVAVEGDSIRVVGPWEAHRAVRELMQGRKVSRRVEAPKGGPGRTAYTLQVENEPVGGVLKALAERLKLQVQVEPAAEERLTARVSFHVTDVSRDELFQAAVRGTGLQCRVVGNELRVTRDE